MEPKNRCELERLEVKERRRMEIIQGATKLFAEKGFEKTTMQHVADELYMGVATVYRYFPKKEELIIAVTNSLLHEYVHAFESINQSNQNGFEKIAALFDYFESHLEPDQLQKAQLLEGFESLIITYNDNMTGFENIMETRQSITDLLFQIIETGKNDGSIRQDIPIDLTIATFVNVFGLFSRKLSLLEKIPILTHTVDNLAQLYLLKKLFLDQLKRD